MTFLENLKYEFKKQSALTILLVTNIVLFLIINISINLFSINILNWLAMPVSLSTFIYRFWTIITFMFSHENLGHVFANMLLLYFNGRMFANLLTERRLLFVYLASGISAGLLMLILGVILPATFSGVYLYGASAAVMGIICAFAMYAPNMPIAIFGIIEMQYKYWAMIIFTIFTILDFSINTGGKISHFGGAAFGLLFGYMLKNGNDISQLSFFKSRYFGSAQQPSNLKVVHSNKSQTVNSISSDAQKTIDALLDKISKNGYESLSKSEKELLFKLSQKK